MQIDKNRRNRTSKASLEVEQQGYALNTIVH